MQVNHVQDVPKAPRMSRPCSRWEREDGGDSATCTGRFILCVVLCFASDPVIRSGETYGADSTFETETTPGVGDRTTTLTKMEERTQGW